jgi:N-acetylglutamate synthase-like GNAT family acetyltransferase
MIRIKLLADAEEFIPAIARWHYVEWPEIFPDPRYVEERLKGRLQKTTLPLTLVAMEKGMPVGCVSLKQQEIKKLPHLTPWLASLIVKKSHRGKGIGKRLLSAAEKKAKALGFKSLYLYTTTAQKFYEENGWTEVQRMTRRGNKIVVLEKKL